ncbi:type II toxin-antitoxin system HicB family antitoxin [Neobittarella massiliensis]|uniref:type II toxin-antitoxin system HicB family antitoxin n=1 Tax=Neobittarella massiliensis (ex Bilen et al. 2018) TaxID=2041842 RepID=UPI000CF663CA|nr:type II toxin-antitoxin system HicB family antitoxin [Neobittarella massiliensis]
MSKLFYPAVFHKAEEGGFWVSFPDLPECLTEGDNMEQAYEMAIDALGLCLTERAAAGEAFPQPSDPSKVVVDDGFLVIVEFDMTAYKKRTSSRAVKKTLTIPEWLNEEATARGVNFSQVLQEALIDKLQAR